MGGGRKTEGRRCTIIAEQSVIPYKYSETRIYLSNAKHEDFCGYLEHRAGNQIWRFDDMVTLLALHERLFSNLKYPQTACELRSMDTTRPNNRKKRKFMTVDKSEMPLETNPTFVVNVLYRQNASWQGTVQWVEGGIEKSFRSTLELIRLMDSVVNGEQGDWI